MNCRECQIQLPAYVDGNVPEAERAVLAEHLDGCPGCTAALNGERNALRRFAARMDADLCHVRLPPAARRRIAAAGRSAGPAGTPERRAWRVTLAAAALLVLASVAGLWGGAGTGTTGTRRGVAPVTACAMAELTNTLGLLVNTACFNTVSGTLAVNTVHRATH
jgi:anti-sigma factor RsiW